MEELLYKKETNKLIVFDRREVETDGTVENPSGNVKYSLGKELEIGDVIEIQGTYSSSTGWYSANILDSSGNILIHINPRRSHGQTGM